MNLDTLPADGGSYILVYRLPAPSQIAVGRLGVADFPSGIYLYCGSARGPGGVRARVGHHLADSPSPHWHIDYFKGAASLLFVGYKTGARRLECLWARALENSSGFEIVAPGFGSSDCSCLAHFFLFTGNGAKLTTLLPGDRSFAGIDTWIPQ